MDLSGFTQKGFQHQYETIIDCPCLLCPDNARCDPTTAISPKSCPRLTDWILGLGKEATDVPVTSEGPNEPEAPSEPSIEEDDSVAESLDT